VCGYVADEDVGSFRGVYEISRPNKDEFEPTSDPNMSGIACVGIYRTLLVESEPH
jgi:catabolite regulation protein CreA